MKEVVKKYVKYTEPTEFYADFQGIKSRENYIYYFDILIKKIKEESIINLGPEGNCHMTKKKIKIKLISIPQVIIAKIKT